MANLADDYWLSKYPACLANHRALSLVDLYQHVYHAYSWMSPPNLTGLQPFWELRPQWTVVYGREIGDYEHDPLHMGVLLYGHGLLVTSLATGAPPVSAVVKLLNDNAALALAHREGRLMVQKSEPGRFRLSVVDGA